MELKTLLSLFPLSSRRERHTDFNAASLTFTITDDKPISILEVDRTKFRQIGTNDSLLLYGIISEPFSIEENDFIKMAKAWLIDSLMERHAFKWDNAELNNFALKSAAKFLEQHLPRERAKVLAYLVTHDTIGSGPISVLLDDSNDIEEIEINSPTTNIAIYHRRYGRCITNLRFNSEPDFRYTINKISSKSGKELGQINRVIDAQLGNCRIHAQTKPYSISGGSASIRINHGVAIGMRELLLNKTVTPSTLAYLWMAIESGKNIVISGAPGSGKTTMLTALSFFINPSCRIVTIEEEINEIRLDNNLTHVVQLQSSESGMDIAEQVKNALHMRPEMLIVGEIRGREANDVFSGSNIGIPFMTTMHSDNDGNDIIARLSSKPMHLEESLAKKLDISIFMRKNPNGSRKLESVSEYIWDDKPGLRPLSISKIVSSALTNEDRIRDSLVLKGYDAAKKGDTVAFKEFKSREAHLAALLSNEMAIDPTVHIKNY